MWTSLKGLGETPALQGPPYVSNYLESYGKRRVHLIQEKSKILILESDPTECISKITLAMAPFCRRLKETRKRPLERAHPSLKKFLLTNILQFSNILFRNWPNPHVRNYDRRWPLLFCLINLRNFSSEFYGKKSWRLETLCPV